MFRFVAMQSGKGRELLQQSGFAPDDLQSFVLIENGRAFRKSTAALQLAKQLPWYWQWTQLFWIVPKRFRDGVYDLIAANRYKWFGRREQCMIPTPEIRSRFIQ